MLALAFAASPVAIEAAHAQAQAQDGVTWLDTIAVIGTRTATSVQDKPASVSVLDEEQLGKKAPESIAELLRDVPGIQVVDSTAPGTKRLSIRGESSRRVTVLVDGQEITDHTTFGTPLLVDPANVERIEVLRGPASVLHGAKAIGGVVNIVTKKGADKPVQAEIGGTYYSGSDGWQGWAAASGTVGNFDYRFSGSLDDHDDRRVPRGQYTSTGRLDRTTFSGDNLSAHLGYRFGETDNHYIAFKASQNRLSSEAWTDPAILTGTTTDFYLDLPKRDLRKYGLYYDGAEISDIVRKVHVDVFYQTVDRLFLNGATVAPLPGRTIAFDTTSDDVNVNWGGTVQADLQFHPDHYTVVGLQYLADELNADKTTQTVQTGFAPFPIVTFQRSSDESSIHSFSAFAQNEWSFADDFKLTTGARYYNTRTDLAYTSDPDRAGYSGTNDGAFVFSAGLIYTGLEDTTLRALYSEGYITPTLTQLFTDTAPSGRLIYGNPALRPETSWNIEVGARYDAGGLVLDGAAFYTEAQDYIATVSCAAVSFSCPTHGDAARAKFTYDNANLARTYGVELAAEYAIAGTGFTPYVAGAWMRRELTFDTFSTYHSNIPALSGRLGLRWNGEIAGHSVWSDLYARAATEVTRLEDGVFGRLPGYGTLNFAFGGSFGDDDKFRYGVAFNNILNKEYRSSFEEIPGTGRSIEATVRMKF
jgi:hemoglobin/transferrin/lactoferrin receptor protein